MLVHDDQKPDQATIGMQEGCANIGLDIHVLKHFILGKDIPNLRIVTGHTGAADHVWARSV